MAPHIHSVQTSKDNTVTICALLKAKICMGSVGLRNLSNFHSDFAVSHSARKPISVGM